MSDIHDDVFGMRAPAADNGADTTPDNRLGEVVPSRRASAGPNARDAARILGVSERTVRRAIARGEIAATRVGGVFCIEPWSLDQYRARRAVGRAGPEPGRAAARRLIPVPLTPLIGREKDVADVAALLTGGEARLVTLTGPGGVGKTRIALETAEAVRDAFPDGVWLVPLAPVCDPALVPVVVAQTVRVPEAAGLTPLDALVRALRDRRLLLVLDNFEQIADAAPFVADLLTACPAVRVLVTSRTRLRLGGEHAVVVRPLPVPGRVGPSSSGPAAAEIEAVPAVGLFVDRARAMDAAFRLTDENAADVAEICRRLDGLPLAIELAAARTRVFSPRTRRARGADPLSLLSDGPRDTPERLRTMRNAIGWSYDLLSPGAQALFRRLAVFVGGFSLDSAGAVAGDGEAVDQESSAASPLPRSPVPRFLDGITALVDASLVNPAPSPDAEARFEMLETIREFGLDRLAAFREDAAVRERHAETFLCLAERAGAAMGGPDQERWFARLETEHANLRATLAWLRERGDAARGLRLCVALSWFWSSRGHAREGEAWLAAFLALPIGVDGGPVRARALMEAANQARWRGDLRRTGELLSEALPECRRLGDDRGAATVLRGLASLAVELGDPERAERLLDESMAYFGTAGSGWDAAYAATLRGRMARERNDLAAAMAHFAGAASRFEANGVRDYAAAAYGECGLVALRAGDLQRARAAYARSLALAAETGDPGSTIEALIGHAWLAHLDGHDRAAARLLGAAAVRLESTGIVLERQIATVYDGATRAARKALGEPPWNAAWIAGRALSTEAAVAIASLPEPADTALALDRLASAHGLSPRETDVLRLMAEGLTDRQIADRLFIAPRTASKHVGAILAKLGVSSRRAAAALAWREAP